MRGAGTLAAWSEPRVLRAMRAWRRGAGALEPWFRATPFAAALHYRDRSLPVVIGAMPAIVGAILRLLPTPTPSTLWILDLPGPLALWTAYALRRRLGMGAALAWQGWYDPRGALDGRREIPLLLGLGDRIAPLRIRRAACLVLDSLRRAPRAAGTLDNRYLLGEEDAPSCEHLAGMGIRQVRAWVWKQPGEDLSAYLAYLARRFPSRRVDGLEDKVGPRG
jgi:hypothetical protein